MPKTPTSESLNPSPRGRRSRGLVVVLAFAGLLLAALAVAGWLVVKRPLTVERWTTVDALEEAGLERGAVDTPGGEMVMWVGGPGIGDPGSGTPEGAPTYPTVVLLHGAGDHAGAWVSVAAGLAERHRVVIPDLPGHGDSDPAEGVLTMETVLGGVVALLETESAASAGLQGRPAPVVIGNSLGGWLALLVGHGRPDLVSRIVVVNGGATPGPQDPAVLLPANREEARALLDLVGAPGPVPDPVVDNLVHNIQQGALARFMAAGDHEAHALSGRIAEIAVPVDLVWGELDGYFPLSYAETYAATLPAARLTVIEDCGHIPPRYCPQAFAETLDEVLAAPPPSPTPALSSEGVEEGGDEG